MITVLSKEKDIATICMKNDSLEVHVTNYGCTILKMIVIDKHGHKKDVVLGYDTIEEYKNRDAYLGMLVGRVANRIKRGSFVLNDTTYSLAINNGPNALHGGQFGFSYQVFDYSIQGESIVFTYISQDGEEGFPGQLSLRAEYTLIKDTLLIRYHATTTDDTLINITNHTYFNLSGEAQKIDDQYIQIHADQYALVDNDGLVTGDIHSVNGTPFDLRELTQFKDCMYSKHSQIQIGKGFDHPFLFNKKEKQVYAFCEKSGIEMIISTSLPQTQLYTGNYLDGRLGKYGQKYDEKSGFCIETQNMPDSIHVEDNPTTILKKGDVYDEFTSYQVRVKDESK